MPEQGLAEWKLDPAHSAVADDRNTDIEAARRMRMTKILVRTGYGTKEMA